MPLQVRWPGPTIRASLILSNTFQATTLKKVTKFNLNIEVIYLDNIAKNLRSLISPNECQELNKNYKVSAIIIFAWQLKVIKKKN